MSDTTPLSQVDTSKVFADNFVKIRKDIEAKLGRALTPDELNTLGDDISAQYPAVDVSTTPPSGYLDWLATYVAALPGAVADVTVERASQVADVASAITNKTTAIVGKGLSNLLPTRVLIVGGLAVLALVAYTNPGFIKALKGK